MSTNNKCGVSIRLAGPRIATCLPYLFVRGPWYDRRGGRGWFRNVNQSSLAILLWQEQNTLANCTNLACLARAPTDRDDTPAPHVTILHPGKTLWQLDVNVWCKVIRWDGGGTDTETTWVDFLNGTSPAVATFTCVFMNGRKGEINRSLSICGSNLQHSELGGRISGPIT